MKTCCSFLLTMILSGFLGCTYGQSDYSVKVPQIIPPSPDAASLGKFADIPVNTYTGIPSISIPIYQIQSRDISLPISLSYHASGIRVEEDASWVGLGWALNASGTISRSVRGNDDFLNEANGKGYIYSDAIPDQIGLPQLNYLNSICNGNQEGQPDIFYFNFLGYSGKFFLARKQSSSDPVKVILLSNNEKIKIDYDEGLKRWTVLTKEGFKYIFGTAEKTKSFSFPVPSYDLPNTQMTDFLMISNNDPLDSKNREVITTWYLDKIISPLKEEVNFEYINKPSTSAIEFASRSVISYSESRKDITGVGTIGSGGGRLNEAPPNVSCGNGSSITGSINVVYNVYLKNIKFSNGQIDFTLGDRVDIEEHRELGTNILYSKPKRLDRIEIKGLSGVKTFKFTHGYFNDTNSQDQYLYKRLRLNQVVEFSSKESMKPYVFSYYGDNVVGTNTSLPIKTSLGRDHWGFYNMAEGINANIGPANQATLIPADQFPGTTVTLNRAEDDVVIDGQKYYEITIEDDGSLQPLQGGSREPNEIASMAGVLTKVQYPTGGSTTLVHESNTFNLINGALEPKDYFVTSEQKEFELPKNALVTISSVLKCGSLSCYGSPNDIPCKESQIQDFSKFYFEIVNQANGVSEYGANYGDYYKKLGVDAPYLFRVEETPCGIQRTKELTLKAGK